MFLENITDIEMPIDKGLVDRSPLFTFKGKKSTMQHMQLTTYSRNRL